MANTDGPQDSISPKSTAPAPLIVPVITLYFGWHMAFVATGSYAAIFIGMATMYLVALIVIHWLSPRLAPAKF